MARSRAHPAPRRRQSAFSLVGEMPGAGLAAGGGFVSFLLKGQLGIHHELLAGSGSAAHAASARPATRIVVSAYTRRRRIGASLRRNRENKSVNEGAYAKTRRGCPEQFVLAGPPRDAIQPEKAPIRGEPMIRRLFALTCLVCLAPAVSGQSDDVKATIAYVQKLQTNTGGFLSM